MAIQLLPRLLLFLLSLEGFDYAVMARRACNLLARICCSEWDTPPALAEQLTRGSEIDKFPAAGSSGFDRPTYE